MLSNNHIEACRIILLVGKELMDFEFESLKRICQCEDIVVLAIFVNNELRLPFVRRVMRVIRKRKFFAMVLWGWRLVKALWAKLVGATDSKYGRISSANLVQLCHADIHYITNLYDPKTVALIKSYKPYLCFHYGYGWIKEPILSLPIKGTIGYHHGDLTKYRGSPPCFWELYNAEKEVGITIQRLKPGLDVGDIIMQRFIKINKDDTLATLRQRVYYETINMGFESVLLMANPDFVPWEPPAIGKLYLAPTLPQYIKFWFKMRVSRFRGK